MYLEVHVLQSVCNSFVVLVLIVLVSLFYFHCFCFLFMLYCCGVRMVSVWALCLN